MKRLILASLLFVSSPIVAFAQQPPEAGPEQLAAALTFLATPPDTAIRDPAMLRAMAVKTEGMLREAVHIAYGAPNPCTYPAYARSAAGADTANVEPYSSCVVAIGLGALQDATTMNHTIASGRCAGASLTAESRDILVGDYTSAPHGKDGFVNIRNELCFWRDSGERVACPPLEPKC